MRYAALLIVLVGCCPSTILTTKSQVIELREGQVAPRSGILVSWDLWNRMTDGLPAPDKNGIISIDMESISISKDHAIIQAWKELKDDRGDFCLEEVQDLSQALYGRNISKDYIVFVVKRYVNK